jgi:hypothetical protein
LIDSVVPRVKTSRAASSTPKNDAIVERACSYSSVASSPKV